MRMRIRLSRKKPSWMTRGVRAAAPKKPMARGWRRMSDAQCFGPPLAEEPGGAEDEHGDEEHEVDHFLPRRSEDVGANDLDARHDEGAEERAHHVPEPAQH